jgi:hypothetical protein
LLNKRPVIAPSIPKPAFPRLLLAVLFGVLHAWLAVSVSPRHSCAYDETAHITAGAFAWREGELRLQPENGLLPQLWITLPLALDPALRLPSTDQNAWKAADVWTLGDQLLHRLGNDPDAVLFRARLMNGLLGGALVAAIVLWASSLPGLAPLMLAGSLGAFSPTLLAHAGFATSDTAGALALLVATLAYWRLIHRVSAGRVAAAGAAAGILALSKFSAALFPVIAFALLAVRLTRRAPLRAGAARLRGWRRLPALLGGSVAAAAIAWGLVWAAHGFRYEAHGHASPTDAAFVVTWERVLLPAPVLVESKMADGSVPPGHSSVLKAGPVQAFVGWAREHRVLPEAWLYGFAFVDRHSRFRVAYFAGDWRATGWTTFFPVAYLVKSTPAELLAHTFALACVIGAWRRGGRGRQLAYRALPLLVAACIYGGTLLAAGLNIGHRHLLPLYVFGALLSAHAVAIGALRPGRARHGRRSQGTILIAAWIAAQVFSATLARPSYLAYFNVLAGGSDAGYRYLVDSSLDWGQDLPALRDWIRENPAPGPLHLAYFGNGDPATYGLGSTIRMADESFDYTPERLIAPSLVPGRYAISATMWNRVYTQVRGPWSDGYETRYRNIQIWLAGLTSKPGTGPEFGPDGEALKPGAFRELLFQFDHLRFGRLVHQLAARRPVRVAHNWFVFDLDADDIAYALEAPPRP